MDRSAELRDFLRSRRARLSPADVGLPWRHDGRRVPGLRREEVAILAGVSVDYYTRLEQGRARNVSDQVLDALSAALRLDGLERDHLRLLARPRRSMPETAHPGGADFGARGVGGVDGAGRAAGGVAGQARPKASAAVRAMVDALDPVPAILHGPLLEVLAINRMGAILFDDFAAMPVRERNMARWTFLDPRARAVYPRWETVAAQMVAILRRAAGQRVDDPALNDLVGELTVRSGDFARWWADHALFQHTHGAKTVHHDLVGDMDLRYQSLVLPQDPGQNLILYTALAGSPTAEKLGLLSTWDPRPGASTAELGARPVSSA
ncbi:helix-turn-helix transcriptional regulator [Pseudofrankia sp. EUN1h]|uniref:helix-turn-helix transcriptional regulator n=2 Tax=Pseudofrankia TaxID=2994363 RepID=UPI000482EE86|nr:helix-turn-helix transcriptional regulator [Pseudofrankia sp. EUN1h]OHV41923.1 hypothetical protein BCD49_01900 [Pseudofrankia sp. EUN1h]